MIQIGQKIYSLIHGGRHGAVYAIHGTQSPNTIHTGAICFGGGAYFDVVYTDGSISQKIPESILHGVQWRILDEVASAEELQQMLAFAEREKSRKAEEEKSRKEKFDAEVAALRNTPEYQYLQTVTTDGPHGSTLVALNIRRELKAAFPGTKFSVTKHGWDAVRVKWTDGPSMAQVRAITRKYKSGYFDAMEDMYQYQQSPWTTVFGGVQYVFEERHYSVQAMERAVSLVCARLNHPLVEVKRRYDGSAYIECDNGILYQHVHDHLDNLESALATTAMQ